MISSKTSPLRLLHTASEIGDDEWTFLEVPMSPWLGSKSKEEKSECQPYSDPGVAESDNLASILAGWLVV